MLSIVSVHTRLQELFVHLDHDLGVISLNELAGSMNTSRDLLMPHLHKLEGLSIVFLNSDAVHLTMRGRLMDVAGR